MMHLWCHVTWVVILSLIYLWLVLATCDVCVQIIITHGDDCEIMFLMHNNCISHLLLICSPAHPPTRTAKLRTALSSRSLRRESIVSAAAASSLKEIVDSAAAAPSTVACLSGRVYRKFSDSYTGISNTGMPGRDFLYRYFPWLPS